ncbi:DNA recombination protein RmuC [Basfia succiniciproducens]|uniref:DNA recombination protein RmuC n=1 Tax=Basfia succiniciproducens TaxID=653940 RepID=A0A1G5CSV1_9PAST|nr:DNA recombination protein RmuC [Basfia succiniciproducens]QIM69551.1 recombinase RmuC [Basfia succiniciproducens]SCY05338.1 DNA recombination protein RmuC [Basfia succiniciproducens]SEQ15091.1 DNA recombination protein RmuC [Basfia succiniciproducens]
MLDLYPLPQDPFQIATVVLAVICLIFLFIMARRKRDVQELQQDLNKNILDFNQLLEKFDILTAAKNQLDQDVIKAQTTAEGLQIRLQERNELIQGLQTELNEEQLRHETLTGSMNTLKERFGVASALVTNLQQQLVESQNAVARKEQDLNKIQEKTTALSQELTELKTTLSEKEKNFAEQQQAFAQSKQQLSAEFQNLANRILEEKSQSFSQSNQIALDALLKPFREQIDGFQKRVNEIHSESLKGNANLESEIKRVLNIGNQMSQEANNLTSALKGEKKTLGNWGEMQLERALQLAGLVKGEHYEAQAHFKDAQGKNNYPDFVVHLPDNKHLVIDSKMSLVAYENAVSTDDENKRQHFLREHVKSVRNHMDDLWRKDYTNLIGMRSPNFVLMFVAVEPAYIEAMKADLNLFNYGYEKNVILVSHTTLMPILRTVANLWRIERGNAEAREISERAGDIYNQICLVAERLAKLGNTLSTVNGHYNSAVTALVGNQGLVGKVERFKDLSAKANKAMPAVEMLHSDLDTEKLLVVKAEDKRDSDAE